MKQPTNRPSHVTREETERNAPGRTTDPAETVRSPNATGNPNDRLAPPPVNVPLNPTGGHDVRSDAPGGPHDPFRNEIVKTGPDSIAPLHSVTEAEAARGRGSDAKTVNDPQPGSIAVDPEGKLSDVQRSQLAQGVPGVIEGLPPGGDFKIPAGYIYDNSSGRYKKMVG